MTEIPNRDRDVEVRFSEVLRPLAGRGRQFKLATAFAGAGVFLLGGLLYFVQPVRRLASVEFRPTFEGGEAGRYPNGLPFGPADVVQASVLDQVYSLNQISDYCDEQLFQSGITAQVMSPGLRFIELEYEARLADARVTAVERQRLQEEYGRRRASEPRQYEVQFLRRGPCTQIPAAVARKVLTDVLDVWARDMINKRGVLRTRVAVLSPSIITDASVAGENLLVRADLVRRAIQRVVDNIRAVERIPGSELVRGGEGRVSFAHIRSRLEDLQQARLLPLVQRAGRSVGADGQAWLDQAVRSSTIEFEAAKQRAEAHRAALRDYSSLGASVPSGPEQLGRGSQDAQSMTPQIDRSFIDRIIEMSSIDGSFRQMVTRDLISASLVAVDREATMQLYRQLSDSSVASGGNRSSEEISAALTAIADEGAAATRVFNELFDEFNRVSLGSTSNLFRIESPADEVTIRTFGFADLALFTTVAVLITPLLMAMILILLYHAKRLFPARATA